MNSAIIFFSDKSAIELHEDDSIIPIVRTLSNNENSASMDKPIKLWEHIHNGLIPSLMDAFCNCDFFYINNNFDIVYGTHSIVKIELI